MCGQAPAKQQPCRAIAACNASANLELDQRRPQGQAVLHLPLLTNFICASSARNLSHVARHDVLLLHAFPRPQQTPSRGVFEIFITEFSCN